MSWSILVDLFQQIMKAVQRNEGVGILLNPTMAAPGRSSGKCWRAISSRIVSVYLHGDVYSCLAKCQQSKFLGSLFITKMFSR